VRDARGQLHRAHLAVHVIVGLGRVEPLVAVARGDHVHAHVEAVLLAEPVLVLVVDLAHEQLGARRHPGQTHAAAPVADGDARRLRAVAGDVRDVGAVVDEVPAADVVHEAVAVVVDRVAVDLAGVGPDAVDEVGVLPPHAAIQVADEHSAAVEAGGPHVGGLELHEVGLGARQGERRGGR
jgi:hypothetical protein